MLFFYLRLSLIILLFGSETLCFGAQWAKVISKKAVIYADQDKTAPIGFIKKGNQVRVGEVLRNHGKLLPIVVNGKIAYIKIEDLNLSQTTELLISPTQRLKKQAKEVNEQRRIALTYNALASSLSTDSGDTETVVFNGGGLRGYIINLKKRRTWRLSVDFVTASLEDEDYNIDISSVTAEYSMNLIQTGPYDFHFYGGFSAIPYAQYARKSDFKENGYGAGLSAGVEMILKFSDTIGIHVDGNYQYTKLFFPLNESVQNDLGIDKFEPSLNGLKFSAALSFSY